MLGLIVRRGASHLEGSASAVVCRTNHAWLSEKNQPSCRRLSDGAKRGYNLDLTGKVNEKASKLRTIRRLTQLHWQVAFVAGVADPSGYGWSIAKQFANAGATVILGTWPPVLPPFTKAMKEGFGDLAKLQNGGEMKIAKVYPLDARFSDPSEVPEDVKTHKRYADLKNYDIASCAQAIFQDFGKVDFLVHSLANGPDASKPLLETSRDGYLQASSASAYSLVSMLQHFGPMMPPGSSVLSISFIGAERYFYGYGGGLSSAKAQLESDTKVLAYEAGRKWGIRVNTISAGPLASRAAIAIKKAAPGERNFIEYLIDYYKANAPLPKKLRADDVGKAALALASDLCSAVTGTCQYVDNGLHAVGMALDAESLKGFATAAGADNKATAKQ